MIEGLRKYIIMLEIIEEMLFDLPELNYDTKIEKFFDKTFELVHNHKVIMTKRLNDKEKEIIK